MDWKRQGGAVITSVTLQDGRQGRVVLVAGRNNPKGAVILFSGESTAAMPLSQFLDAIAPHEAAEILCMQERIFGPSHLNAPVIA